MVGAAGGAFISAGLLAGCLLLAGMAVHGLLGLLLMKEISALEFVIYLGVFLVVVMAGVMCWGTPLVWAPALTAVSLAVGFPLARSWANTHAIVKMEQADIERYLESVQKRPDIPYPLRRLAEIHFGRGHYEVAAQWYGKYMERVQDAGIEFRIKRCTELMERAGKRVKVCTECQHQNPGAARYCVSCGAILPGAWEIIQAFHGKAGKRYLLQAIVVSLVVGVLLGFVTSLSHIYAVLCFWIAAAAFVYYLYKRVTSD